MAYSFHMELPAINLSHEDVASASCGDMYDNEIVSKASTRTYKPTLGHPESPSLLQSLGITRPTRE